MPNIVRGESELVAGGKSYRLLLTLGALAEIEDGLGLSDLSEVGARLKQVRAADLAVVAAALMRGAGHEITPADVLRLPCDLGALVQAVSLAFERAGLAAEGEGGSAREAGPASEGSHAPFPGTPGSRSD
jgi:hypothetical protein